MRSVVKQLMARDGVRKVEIFRRDDGSYGFESFRFSDDSLEMGWIPYERYSECFAADEEIAEREARSRFDWLEGAP